MSVFSSGAAGGGTLLAAVIALLWEYLLGDAPLA